MRNKIIPMYPECQQQSKSCKKKLSEDTKKEIYQAVSQQFGWAFGNSDMQEDIEQVQQSLEAEGKNPNDAQTLKRDLEDYAHQTHRSMAA